MEARDAAAVRRHRSLCWLAVLHAGVILGTTFPVLNHMEINRMWRIWTGLTTLWFFWPLILSLGRGSTKRSVYVAMGLSAALLAFPVRTYCYFAAYVFAPAGDLRMISPYSVVPYVYGFVRGWTEGKSRAGDDSIIVEGYGFGCYAPAAPPFSQEMALKYRVQTRAIAGCGVSDYILGHARGYNIASSGEIKRRYGSAVIVAAENEWKERQERIHAEHARGSADAENDAHNGRLAILLYEHATDEEAYREMLRERYQTELRRVAENPQAISENELSYVFGYNEASTRELKRRFGDEGQRAAWLVGTEPFEQFARNAQRRRAQAPN